MWLQKREYMKVSFSHVFFLPRVLMWNQWAAFLWAWWSVAHGAALTSSIVWRRQCYLQFLCRFKPFKTPLNITNTHANWWGGRSVNINWYNTISFCKYGCQANSVIRPFSSLIQWLFEYCRRVLWLNKYWTVRCIVFSPLIQNLFQHLLIWIYEIKECTYVHVYVFMYVFMLCM